MEAEKIIRQFIVKKTLWCFCVGHVMEYGTLWSFYYCIRRENDELIGLHSLILETFKGLTYYCKRRKSTSLLRG